MFTREKLILVCYLVVLLFSGLGYTVTEIRNATQAIKYLIQFGYFTPTTMDPNMIHKIKRESVKDAIIDFQTFSGLPTTGELDSDTFKMMNIPRCGCIDRFYRTRFKRYGHFLETWRVDNLTYRIVKYPSANLNKVQTDLEFRRAFDDWSSIMPIDFNERSSGPVNNFGLLQHFSLYTSNFIA
ncbi:matrix metalloproteinase-27-like [Daktulosphaira vitifoliae]|uniref:matrix metalloproteinase-27-like n=1 Tax=Daktulosphaira vitifoliae TaxID=58002 RepID=UPI0021AA7D7C|nr:matrix metalloproteinase-27-like [Daktulosphaira vitifoliae]XP_050546013.1 matrix metalloproteinase-27-like [Daktulosphaira vitifoliae]XP_050546014.1 matrix metalloproteinase-27-like [Daktulosphaira vitifoliae]